MLEILKYRSQYGTVIVGVNEFLQPSSPLIIWTPTSTMYCTCTLK